MQILKTTIKFILSLFLPIFEVSPKKVYDTYIHDKIYVGLDSKYDKRLKSISINSYLINKNQLLKVKSRGTTTSDDFSDVLLSCVIIIEL